MITILKRRDTTVEFTDEEYREVKEALDQSLEITLKQWGLGIVPLPSSASRAEPQVLLDKILKNLLSGVLDPVKIHKYQVRKKRIAKKEVRRYAWQISRGIKECTEGRYYRLWERNSLKSTVEWTTMDLQEYGKRFSYPSQINSLVGAINQQWSTVGTADLKFEVIYLSVKIIISGTAYKRQTDYGCNKNPARRGWVEDTMYRQTKDSYYYPGTGKRSDPFLTVQTPNGIIPRTIAVWNEYDNGITPVDYFLNSDKKEREAIIPDPNIPGKPESEVGFLLWDHKRTVV